MKRVTTSWFAVTTKPTYLKKEETSTSCWSLKTLLLLRRVACPCPRTRHLSASSPCCGTAYKGHPQCNSGNPQSEYSSLCGCQTLSLLTPVFTQQTGPRPFEQGEHYWGCKCWQMPLHLGLAQPPRSSVPRVWGCKEASEPLARHPAHLFCTVMNW